MQKIRSKRNIVESEDSCTAAVRCLAGGGLLGRMYRLIFPRRGALERRHEIAILYFGRTSEFLMMTSERMAIPAGRYTLGQLIGSLHKRGDRWVDELDDSHLVCMVNGREARSFHPVKAGDEVCFSSTKSIFEA